MNASFVLPLPREVYPPRISGVRAWQSPALSALEYLKEGADCLKKKAAQSRSLFSTHVYDNPEFNLCDAQEHRARLFELLSFGERVSQYAKTEVLEKCTGAEREEAEELLDSTDKLVAELFAELLKWHAPAEMQTDLPQSLKESFAELDAGKVEELAF